MKNVSFAPSDQGDMGALVGEVARAEKEIGGSPRRLYHLAVPPVAFTSVVQSLGASGLATHTMGRGLIEDPLFFEVTF